MHFKNLDFIYFSVFANLGIFSYDIKDTSFCLLFTIFIRLIILLRYIYLFISPKIFEFVMSFGIFLEANLIFNFQQIDKYRNSFALR